MRVLPALSSPALNLLKGPKGLLLLIIILAGFLRLWDLPSTPPGLYPDEAMNGNNALEALATNDWKVFYPENNGREGLFINIQSLSLAVFGNEPWVLRLPSTIFGILTVLGIYFLTRELFSNGYEIRNEYESTKDRDKKGSYIRNSFVFRKDAIALLAAFLLAVSFWHINFSRIGFRAIMAPFFLTWGVYFTLLALRYIKESKNYWLPIIIAGVVYTLGWYSYIAYRATPLILLVILIAYWLKLRNSAERKGLALATILFAMVSVITLAPLTFYFIQNPADFFGRTTEVSIFNGPSPLKDFALNTIKTFGMLNFVGDYNWRHNLSGAPQLFWPVGIMFLVGIFTAIKSLIRNSKFEIRNSSLAILFVWLGVAMLPVVISNEGMPHALRAIIMIPPVFILSAVGGVWGYHFLLSKISSNSHGRESLRRLLKTGSVALLLFILLNAYSTYFIRWAKNPNTADAFAKNYVEIGKQLNSLPVEQPKYVIVNASGVDVRGLPMPTQTVMFLTDTFTPEKQAQKNTHYLLPSEVDKIKIPESAFVIPLN